MATYGHVDVEYNKFITSVNDPETGFPDFDANGDALVADIADFGQHDDRGTRRHGSLIMQYTFPCIGYSARSWPRWTPRMRASVRSSRR